ncbi:hypothetical protein D3C73_699980 [compost metagenome]
MLEGHFLEQVLEQERLVGQQQRIAMQQVDLELADAHLMHEGIAGQSQGRHARVDFIEERPQAVIGTDAERRLTVLAATVLPHRWLERLSRVGVRRKNEELKLGRHHGRQAAGRVTGNYCLELATGRQIGAGGSAQFVRVANGECPRRVAPGQAMDLCRVRNQCQVAIIAAIKTRRRISAHDALQQHTPRQLQTSTVEKTLGGHHFAPWYAVQIRRDTFNFINARQSLRE